MGYWSCQWRNAGAAVKRYGGTVKAPGAKDAKVENQTGVRTDWRGYAVLPYATEYREKQSGAGYQYPG